MKKLILLAIIISFTGNVYAKKPTSFIGKIAKRAAIGAVAVGTAAYAMKQNADSSGYERIITKDGMLGCSDRGYFDRVASYSKDITAFKKAMEEGISSGNCLVFTKGEKVWVVNQALLDNRFKLRKEGQLDGYWTVTDAVR